MFATVVGVEMVDFALFDCEFGWEVSGGVQFLEADHRR